MSQTLSLSGRALLAPLLIFGFLALAPLFGLMGAPNHILALFSRVMIFAIAALALDLVLGYGALVSFGHAAFMGIGAYAAGILIEHGFGDVFLGLAVALLASGVFAALTGLVSLRTKGAYFIMITLAFGQMAYFVATSLRAYGGDDGLSLISRSSVFGTALLKQNLVFYYLVFALLLGCYLFSRSLIASRFGRILRGAKDNPTRMAAIGVNVRPYQLVAYTLSGMMTGLAGFLLANQAEFVSPAFMTWQRSGELIVMVMLGGVGTLHGAILGALAFLMAEEFLAPVTEHWKVIFGPLLVLVVLFARGGLISLFGGRKA